MLRPMQRQRKLEHSEIFLKIDVCMDGPNITAPQNLPDRTVVRVCKDGSRSQGRHCMKLWANAVGWQPGTDLPHALSPPAESAILSSSQWFTQLVVYP